jgi:bifunctional Delta-12/omega-3 fatty acid desaturase
VLKRSLFYLARDIFAVWLLCYVAIKVLQSGSPAKLPVLLLYGFIQGLFFTGLWVLAHECGHDAFSPHRKLNSVVGFFLHSALLVPFFSWKYSHSRHHRYHNHLDKDTVFVPSRKSEVRPSLWTLLIGYSVEDVPLLIFCSFLLHQLLGWPAYILVNASAGQKSLAKGDRNVSTWRKIHLDPTAYVFASSERPYVLLSDAGIFLMLCVLKYAQHRFGLATMFLLYGVPYLWMNDWISTCLL